MGVVISRWVKGSPYPSLAIGVRDLVGQGVTALIAGCTEVSLVLSRHQPELPWLDPLQILAETLVREASAR